MGYADALFDLTGKVVVVTGGSRGLGRQMAFGAAQCGADVVIASRDFESCATTAKDIEEATGRTAMPFGVHVGRWDQLDGLTDAVYDRFGRADVLVNNAGMSPVYDSVSDVSEKMFDSVVNLNLKGPFRLSVLFGERMHKAGSGSIINVSSTGSIRPAPWIIPYAAAKAGLNALTEGLSTDPGTSRPRQHIDVRTVLHRRQQALGPRGHQRSHQGPRPAAGRRSARDHRRRTLSDVRRIQLHQRRDPSGRRRHPVNPKEL